MKLSTVTQVVCTIDYPEFCYCDNHSRYRTCTRTIGEEIRVYRRWLVNGQQPILRWELQETRIDSAYRNLLHRLLPHLRNHPRYDSSSSTCGIYIRFQERRLDDARRSSVCVHFRQTADAQRGSSDSSLTPHNSPSGTCSHPNSTRTSDIRVQTRRSPQGSSHGLRLRR